MINKIKEKLWNIDLIVEEIKLFPQTYKTILGKHYSHGTYQLILRRKINNLCKDGTICKTTIPGTRFGQVILYTLPKKYHIVVEADRIKNKIYVFFDSKNLGKFYIGVDNCWLLNGNKWKKLNGETKIFKGNILKWV